jgi:uncharacterized protein YraI
MIGALAAAPQPADAQEVAYAVPGTTNVRAGPGTEYYVVTQVRGGEQVYVYGCLSDRSWCDILAHGVRGWIYAPRLQFPYNGTYVLVPDYYRYFGAPIISFNFGYWDRYYRDYPWYRTWRRDPDPNAPPPGYNDGGVTNWPGVEHPAPGGGNFWAPQDLPGGGGQPGGSPGVSGGPTPAPGGPGGFGGGADSAPPPGGGGSIGGGSPGVSGGRCPIWKPNC